jgi:hypothetical protein
LGCTPPIWGLSYLNIYLKFTYSYHTVWFVGFFVIFALGRLIFIYNDRIAKLSLFSSTNKVLLLTFSCYLVSNIESIIILVYGHNINYINTLRLGNIAYSLSAFYLLNMILVKNKISLPFELSFYFIYLIHPFVLRISSFPFKNHLIEFKYPSQLIFNLVYLSIIFSLCIVVHDIFFNLRVKNIPVSLYIFNKKIIVIKVTTSVYSTFISSLRKRYRKSIE